MKRKNLYLYLLTLAYCLPVLVAAFISESRAVAWALIPLAVNFLVFWLCLKNGYEHAEYNEDDVNRRRTHSTYVTLLLGFMIALLVLATRSPVVVCSSLLMPVVSWLVYIVV